MKNKHAKYLFLYVLTFSWSLDCLAINMTKLLSKNNKGLCKSLWLRSLQMNVDHLKSVARLAKAMYYASALKLETMVCFFNDQATKFSLTNTQ